MDQIKRWYRSVPIYLALFLAVIAALLIASCVSNIVATTFNELSLGIQVKYITAVHDLTEAGEVTYSGDDTENVVEYDFNYDNYSDEDQRLYLVYRAVLHCAPFIIYSISIFAAVLLFYVSKLRIPLKLLVQASDRIAGSELNFTLHYSGTDEMARLCAAFEKMRGTLDANNQQMLYMIDQRKKLNDAYTHDLRTPIAILKGHTDMLTKYLPSGKMQEDEVMQTVCTMSAQVLRLEQFVESMNTVQKLDDLEIQKERIDAIEFIEHLRDSADILCQSKNLKCLFESNVILPDLHLDDRAVIQVYDNIMSNAVRHAYSKVTIHCACEDGFFYVSITDDGKGFSEKDLLKADQPYYSGDTHTKDHHFGLGLHICRTICEKHKGWLKYGNTLHGGAIITAYFSIA